MPRVKSPDYEKGFQDGKKAATRDCLIQITNSMAEYKEEISDLNSKIKKQKAKVTVSVTVAVVLVLFELGRFMLGGV